MWLQFLDNADDSRLLRLFIDFTTEQAYSGQILNFYSDASRNSSLGMGATFAGRRWLQYQWPEGFVDTCEPSIEFLELFALTTTLVTWREEPVLQNRRFVIFCDNQAVVSMVNKLATSCLYCMKLIRIIALEGITKNRKVMCIMSSHLKIFCQMLCRILI